MEAFDAVVEIDNYIRNLLADDKFDPHMSTWKHLGHLLEVCDEVLQEGGRPSLEQVDEHSPEPVKVSNDGLVISCDASSKTNPGGPCSVGVVIELRGVKIHSFARTTPALTVNQAEYDAVYESLLYLGTLLNDFLRDLTSIKIYSDSQLIVNQLNGIYKVSDESLKKRHESVSQCRVQYELNSNKSIEIIWAPRCSTPGLKLANALAQKEIGVPIR